MVNSNTSFNINEMILHDATSRTNILKSARNLGYESLRRQSVQYKISLTPTMTYDEFVTDTIIFRVPKFSKFKSKNYDFYYLGDDIERVIHKDDVLNRTPNSIIDINVTEGKLVSYSKDENLSYVIGTYVDENANIKVDSSILLQYENIEENGIFMYVTTTNDVDIYFQNTVPTLAKKDSIWVNTDYSNGKVKDILDNTEIYVAKSEYNSVVRKGEWEYSSVWKDTSNSYLNVYKSNPDSDLEAVDPKTNREFRRREYFVIDDIDVNKDTFLPLVDFTTGFTRAHFSYAGTGKNLFEGSIVNVILLISSGEEANVDVSEIKIDDSYISNSLEIVDGSIPLLTKIGTEVETNESIKEQAPNFFNTANRAVTKKDYETIIERLTSVHSAVSWGGESEIVPTPGYIIISMFNELTANSSDDFTYNPDESTFRLTYMDIFNNLTGVALQPNSDVYYNEHSYLTDIESKGIVNYMDRYKMLTMIINYVNPIFVNFDFKIDVLRYQSDIKNTNTAMFNVVNNYFKVDLNDFGTEYFESTLIRLLDEQLGNTSGFNIKMYTNIVISNGNFIKNKTNSRNYDVNIYLEHPFEEIFDGNSQIVNTSNLPNIDTSLFLKDTNVLDTLHVDFLNVRHNFTDSYLTEDGSGIYKLNIYPIKMGSSFVGEYIIVNSEYDSDSYILVNLWIKDSLGGSDGKYDTSILETSHFSQPQLLRLGQVSNNIRFTRNTIPRLNSIDFS